MNSLKRNLLPGLVGLALLAAGGCDDGIMPTKPHYQDYPPTGIVPETGRYRMKWDVPSSNLSEGPSVGFDVAANSRVFFASGDMPIVDGAFEYRHGVNFGNGSDDSTVNPTDGYLFEGHFNSTTSAVGSLSINGGWTADILGPYTFTATKSK